MNKQFLILGLALLASCASKTSDKSASVISMQIIDRNGFTETISNKERLSSFEKIDFLTPQPFQKVLRVYGRNPSSQSLSKITSYHDNGQLCQYLEAVDGRAHGIYREWFPNGQLKIEASVVEGVADIHDLAKATWIFQGPCKVWEDQGNLIGAFHYEKGVLHSPAHYYFKSGKLQKIIPYAEGEIHGTLQVFDEEGNTVQEVPYFKNEKQGKATTFWEPGHLLSSEMYSQDRLIEASYYDKNGQCVAEVKGGHGKQAQFKEERLGALFTIQQGCVEGEVQFFNPSGTLYCTYTLLEGKKNGQEWEYFPSEPGKKTTPKLCIPWIDDKIQGQVKTWYPNGQIESQREIHDNKKQGNSFAWYKNGDLMLTEEYENDLLIKGTYYKRGDKQAVSRIDSGKGTASLYSSEGIFIKKVPYEKGKPQLHQDSLQ